MSTTKIDTYETDESDIAVDTMITAGADALQSNYEIGFKLNTTPNGPFTESDIDNNSLLLLKVNAQQINIPHLTAGTYQKKYKTISVDLPGGAISGARTFQVTFNIDANYTLYSYLCKIANITAIPSAGYTFNIMPKQFPLSYITISVMDNPFSSTTVGSVNNLYGEDDSATGTQALSLSDSDIQWVMRYCWIRELSHGQYSYGSSNAATCSATFGWIDLIDPQRFMAFQSNS